MQITFGFFRFSDEMDSRDLGGVRMRQHDGGNSINLSCKGGK